MIQGRHIVLLLREPQRFLADRLRDPEAGLTLLTQVGLPLMAIRALALLVRSLLFGTLLPGLVLAIGSLALLVGVWLGLSLVLPALARQFRFEVRERDAFVLVTFASVPLWLAGLFYVAPDDLWFFALWSRLLVLAVSSYGLYIMARGLVSLNIDRKLLPAMLTAIGIAFLTIYLPLSLMLAFTSHLVLFLIGD